MGHTCFEQSVVAVLSFVVCGLASSALTLVINRRVTAIAGNRGDILGLVEIFNSTSVRQERSVQFDLWQRKKPCRVQLSAELRREVDGRHSWSDGGPSRVCDCEY